MKLGKHERVVKLKPVGISYICEICHEGEMIVDNREPIIVPLGGLGNAPMRSHYCNKCGAQMKLPKSYPYVEWLTEEEYEELMGKKNNTEVDNEPAKVHVDNEAELSGWKDYSGL